MSRSLVLIGLALSACLPLHKEGPPPKSTSHEPKLPDDFPWAATDRLLERAGALLTTPAFTVTRGRDKSEGAYLQDYVSRAKARTIEARQLEGLANAMKVLATAYAVTGNDTYPERAAYFLDAFFLDPSSGMLPRMSFAGFSPRRARGSAEGLRDGRHFVTILDALNVLSASPRIDAKFEEDLRGWFSRYLTWLTQGDFAADAPRLEGTDAAWYHLQVARIARYTGAALLAKKELETLAAKLGAKLESAFEDKPAFAEAKAELCAYFLAARLGESLGVPLWRAGPMGRDLRTMFASLATDVRPVNEGEGNEEAALRREQELLELVRLADDKLPKGASAPMELKDPVTALFPCR